MEATKITSVGHKVVTYCTWTYCIVLDSMYIKFWLSLEEKTYKELAKIPSGVG